MSYLGEKEYTSPIPVPNISLPSTNTEKLGANAVTSAPTKYSNAATMSSLLLPKNQNCHVSFTMKAIANMITFFFISKEYIK